MLTYYHFLMLGKEPRVKFCTLFVLGNISNCLFIYLFIYLFDYHNNVQDCNSICKEFKRVGR